MTGVLFSQRLQYNVRNQNCSVRLLTIGNGINIAGSKIHHSNSYTKFCGLILNIRCHLPPRKKEETLQFLHIPKTGTSVNWFLRDYFDCTVSNDSNPCDEWLQTVKNEVLNKSNHTFSYYILARTAKKWHV